ncbi:protein SHOOT GRAVITROPISM 5-like [Panicum miliaceum]|uniref:Protein SHOOT GRAVITROPISM 5-like n=1 Tax=Panicum miliaceum TaxID=4540 RepID=A0A3L6RND8_PANMI|nr:protein SHOOT GRAVITROPISM 5-like [Panicum miliaceum]
MARAAGHHWPEVAKKHKTKSTGESGRRRRGEARRGGAGEKNLSLVPRIGSRREGSIVLAQPLARERAPAATMSSPCAPTAVLPPEEAPWQPAPTVAPSPSLQVGIGRAAMKKRRLRGTPRVLVLRRRPCRAVMVTAMVLGYYARLLAHGADLGAEVVALSPPALLERNRRCVCEACGRGFRHRRNLSVGSGATGTGGCTSGGCSSGRPGRGEGPAPKRLFVRGCRYDAPSCALADVPSLRKHFRRKHGRHGLWACGRGDGPADCKARLKTCGTRTSGHTCDGCGVVFSQLESYVEH